MFRTTSSKAKKAWLFGLSQQTFLASEEEIFRWQRWWCFLIRCAYQWCDSRPTSIFLEDQKHNHCRLQQTTIGGLRLIESMMRDPHIPFDLLCESASLPPTLRDTLHHIGVWCLGDLWPWHWWWNMAICCDPTDGNIFSSKQFYAPRKSFFLHRIRRCDLSDLNHLKCHHITNVLIHQSVSAILCRMARIVTTTITIKIQHHWQRESQFAS